MKILQHVIQLRNQHVRLSSTQRIVFDPSDNTMKLFLSGGDGGQTAWLQSSEAEYLELCAAWDEYLERTTPKFEEITKHVS